MIQSYIMRTASLLHFSFIIILISSLSSCQEEACCAASNNIGNTSTLACKQEDHSIQKDQGEKQKTQHEYGGWYCPDNLRGFPAIDVQDLSTVPVVIGRMPTKEETRNGSALMFIDPEIYPNARPIDIQLPALATYYNQHTDKDEVIILIQAAVIDADSIVGFRYANGGNGSAWFSEVDFLSANEVKQLGSRPFVAQSMKIDAPRDKIWKIMTGLTFENDLMASLNEDAFLTRAWQSEAKVEYPKIPGKAGSIGKVSSIWEGVYAQLDYVVNGENYVQKLFINENPETGTCEVKLVSGPYFDNLEQHKSNWINFLQTLKGFTESYQKGGASWLEEQLLNEK